MNDNASGAVVTILLIGGIITGLQLWTWTMATRTGRCQATCATQHAEYAANDGDACWCTKDGERYVTEALGVPG